MLNRKLMIVLLTFAARDFPTIPGGQGAAVEYPLPGPSSMG